VYLPISDLSVEDAAREVVYHPGRFISGAVAPYTTVESDVPVFLTRFHDGSALFLNSSNTDAHIHYSGHYMMMSPHSIREADIK
jgi:hypothetical protein